MATSTILSILVLVVKIIEIAHIWKVATHLAASVVAADATVGLWQVALVSVFSRSTMYWF